MQEAARNGNGSVRADRATIIREVTRWIDEGQAIHFAGDRNSPERFNSGGNGWNLTASFAEDPRVVARLTGAAHRESAIEAIAGEVASTLQFKNPLSVSDRSNEISYDVDDAPAQRLFKSLGPPATRTVKTGKPDGNHYHFERPAGYTGPTAFLIETPKDKDGKLIPGARPRVKAKVRQLFCVPPAWHARRGVFYTYENETRVLAPLDFLERTLALCDKVPGEHEPRDADHDAELSERPELRAIVERLHARKVRRGWEAKCPVHNGEGSTSLYIAAGDHIPVILSCLAGCTQEQVRASDALKDIPRSNGALRKLTALSPDAPSRLPRPGAAVFSLVDLRTMKVRAVEWVEGEEPFLARGELHILQGHGSAGKGALTCRWHAEASKRKEHTLMVSAEDDIERQIIPRLIAAGADFEFVHLLNVHRQEHEDALEIPGDLPELEQFITDNRIQFVSIDPLLTHITGDKDSYKDHEIKRVLTPLSKLAQRTSATVIGVHHFKKDTSGGARHSGQASTAFATTARIVLSMAKSAKREGIHILEVSKSNIGAEDVGLDLRLEVVEVPAEDGKVAKVPLLHREGEAGEALETVDEALAKPRRGSKSAVARELILDILDDVPRMESDALDSRVAQETGVTTKTVRNLRGELGSEGIGLIRSLPSEENDARGKQIWFVSRTGAPRTPVGDE